jgi:ferredoxin
MKRFRYLTGVVSLALDARACVGCGMCVTVCPHRVFALEGGRAVLRDRDACIECGACSRNCAPGAVTVKPGTGCATLLIQSWLRGLGLPGRDGGTCCGE